MPPPVGVSDARLAAEHLSCPPGWIARGRDTRAPSRQAWAAPGEAWGAPKEAWDALREAWAAPVDCCAAAPGARLPDLCAADSPPAATAALRDGSPVPDLRGVEWRAEE